MKRQSAIKTALFFLLIHSLYVGFVFWYVHSHQRPRDYFEWSLFFPYFDRPLVDIGFRLDRLFHFTGSLSAWWQSLGFSGHNLRYGLIYLLFGGVQWGILGFITGALFGSSSSGEEPVKPGRRPKKRPQLAGKKGSKDKPAVYVPASVPADRELFVDGLCRDEEGAHGPRPARSDYFAVESAGVIVRGEQVAYFLNLRVLRPPPGERPEIRIEYENPLRRKKPFVESKTFPPTAARIQLISPALLKGVKGGKTYTIRVFLHGDVSDRNALDRLEQPVTAYVDYRGGEVEIATGIEPRLRSQILVDPVKEG